MQEGSSLHGRVGGCLLAVTKAAHFSPVLTAHAYAHVHARVFVRVRVPARVLVPDPAPVRVVSCMASQVRGCHRRRWRFSWSCRRRVLIREVLVDDLLEHGHLFKKKVKLKVRISLKSAVTDSDAQGNQGVDVRLKRRTTNVAEGIHSTAWTIQEKEKKHQ